MRIYKKKYILIISCFFVSSLNMETSGMQEKLKDNLELAGAACNVIKTFEVLNKPTQCEVLFKPIKEASGFQVVENPVNNKDIVMVISPTDKNWNGIPTINNELYNTVKMQTDLKQQYEYSHLNDILLKNNIQNNEEISYIRSILLYRISKCVLGSFKKGNCGELVAYSTFFLLQERHNNALNFNLEVMQLTSNLLKPDQMPFTHVIGVIDREMDSPTWPPSLWGNDAVVYDPWNNGVYFSASHMIERDYYKHGKWEKCETIASFNISRDNLSSFFTSYEKYIIEIEIPLGVLFDYRAAL